MRRLWLLPLVLLLANPASAAPDLLLPAGAAGAVLPYRLTGQLGASGLVVEATPTMLLIQAVAPGSPAALADVPVPGGERLRLAAINGRPVEAYRREELLRCFTASAGQVDLTFARKEEGAPAERLAGPYTVHLTPGANFEREAAWLLDQGRDDELLQRLKARPVSAALGGKLLLAAEQLARTGDHGRALALASRVPAGHAAYAEARRLYARIRLTYANEVLGRADALAAEAHVRQRGPRPRRRPRRRRPVPGGPGGASGPAGRAGLAQAAPRSRVGLARGHGRAGALPQAQGRSGESLEAPLKRASEA